MEKKLTSIFRTEKIRQVNIVLYGLYPKTSSQPSLLDTLKNKTQEMKKKNTNL